MKWITYIIPTHSAWNIQLFQSFCFLSFAIDTLATKYFWMLRYDLQLQRWVLTDTQPHCREDNRVAVTAQWKIHLKSGCLLWVVAPWGCWVRAPGPLDFQENPEIPILWEISTLWNIRSNFLERTIFCWINTARLQAASSPCTASLLSHFDM